MGISGAGMAIFGFVLGLIIGWIIIRKGRQPIQFDVPAIEWVERPVAIWKQDWTQTVMILIHSLSILAISALYLLDQNVSLEILGSTRVTSAALWMTWLVAGSVFSFSFIYPYAGKMPMFVFLNAFARGQYVGDWDCFSHFNVDLKTRMIYLFAARFPEIVRVAWQPTTEAVFEDVLSVLRSVLPEKPENTPLPIARRRWVLIAAMIVLVLPFIIAGVVIFLSSVIWGWVYYTIAVLLLMILGITLIKKFDIG